MADSQWDEFGETASERGLIGAPDDGTFALVLPKKRRKAAETTERENEQAQHGIMQPLTVSELKSHLQRSGVHGIALDIDETLSATNIAWFERLVALYGNPDGLPVPELIAKYHLAQNNPAWQSEAAQSWMQTQRDAPEAQDGLPLIDGAVEGVAALAALLPIAAYLTVRPSNVSTNTIAWLTENGFPAAPVVSKPVDIAFTEGNQWKARSLHELWPHVTGIVDDNPKLHIFAGKDYPGKLYLFGRAHTEPEYEWAVACATWPQVVEAIRKAMHRHLGEIKQS